MKQVTILLMAVTILYNCGGHQPPETEGHHQSLKAGSNTAESYSAEHLTLVQAHRLAQLPLNCIQTEYPNKTGQTLGSKEDLHEPHVIHPAFFGCFDWHSSVHGHWSLVKLLKMFPDLEDAGRIREMLSQNLSKTNISPPHMKQRTRLKQECLDSRRGPAGRVRRCVFGVRDPAGTPGLQRGA